MFQQIFRARRLEAHEIRDLALVLAHETCHVVREVRDGRNAVVRALRNHGIEVVHRDTLHDGLLDAKPASISLVQIEGQGLVGVLQSCLHVSESGLSAERIVVVTRLVDQIGEVPDVRIAALA